MCMCSYFVQRVQYNPRLISLHLPVCAVCGKGFQRSDHLRVHKELHENVKNVSSRHTASAYAASAAKRLSGFIHIEELIEHLEAARSSRSPRRCRKRRRICRFKRSHSDYEASASSSSDASSVSSRASSRSRSPSSSARSASAASSNDSDNDHEATVESETPSVAQSTHSFPAASASLAAASHQNTRYSFSSFEQCAGPSSSRAHKRSTNSDRHHSPRRRSSTRRSHCEHCSSRIKSSRKECSCSHCPVHQRNSHHSSRHSQPQHSHSSSVAPAKHDFHQPALPQSQRPHPPVFNRLSSPTFMNHDDMSASVSAYAPPDELSSAAAAQLPAAALNLLPPANRLQNSVVDCLTLAGTNYPTSVQIECGSIHRNQQQQGSSLELLTPRAPSGISPLGLLPSAQQPAATALVPFSSASTSDATLVTPQSPLETIRVLFQCPADDCSQRFDSQGALREHIRKHLSGELPSQLFGLLPPNPAAAGAFSSSPPQQQQHALGFRAAPPPPHPAPTQTPQQSLAVAAQPNGQFFVPDSAVTVTPNRASNGAFNFVNAAQTAAANPAAAAAPPPPSAPTVYPVANSLNPLLSVADESLMFGLSESDQSSLLNALNLMAPYNDVGSLFTPMEPPAPPVSDYLTTLTPLPPGFALHASFSGAMQPTNGAAAANGATSSRTTFVPIALTPNVSALTLPNVGNARSRGPSKRLISPPAPYALY